MNQKIKLSPGEKAILFLLALFLLFRLPFWFAAWQMRQAIDSFDAHETDFEISTFIPLPPLDMRSDQLTTEQLALIQQYVDSYRFEKTVFLREFRVDGGPRVFLGFRHASWPDIFGGRPGALDRPFGRRLGSPV